MVELSRTGGACAALKNKVPLRIMNSPPMLPPRWGQDVAPPPSPFVTPPASPPPPTGAVGFRNSMRRRRERRIRSSSSSSSSTRFRHAPPHQQHPNAYPLAPDPDRIYYSYTFKGSSIDRRPLRVAAAAAAPDVVIIHTAADVIHGVQHPDSVGSSPTSTNVHTTSPASPPRYFYDDHDRFVEPDDVVLPVASTFEPVTILRHPSAPPKQRARRKCVHWVSDLKKKPQDISSDRKIVKVQYSLDNEAERQKLELRAQRIHEDMEKRLGSASDCLHRREERLNELRRVERDINQIEMELHHHPHAHIPATASLSQNKKRPRVPKSANLEQLYHESLPLDKALSHSGPPLILGPLQQSDDAASVISFTSSAHSLNDAASSRRLREDIDSKIGCISSLVSLLGCTDLDKMSTTFLAMSSSPANCDLMRNHRVIPLLVQILHGSSCQGQVQAWSGNSQQTDQGQERAAPRQVRFRVSRALHNIVHSLPNDKTCKREAKVLRLLEMLRMYTDLLRDVLRTQSSTTSAGGHCGPLSIHYMPRQGRMICKMDKRKSCSPPACRAIGMEDAERQLVCGHFVNYSSDNDISDQVVAINIEETMALLTRCSFDELLRQPIFLLGGIPAIAELIQVEREAHGQECLLECCQQQRHDCIEVRRYAVVALTNLTFGNAQIKSFLCSFPHLIDILVLQLQSRHESLIRATAHLIRNLAWKADKSSKQMLSQRQVVLVLMAVAMAIGDRMTAEPSKEESTLKVVLSALWNLSAHCRKNKADICSMPGALGFLVQLLKCQSTPLIENGGGILRNISSFIATSPEGMEYRAILRENSCLEVLLQHLKSSSLTVVSNACGTLWNLSARCSQDQARLWSLGAVPLLHTLTDSKHTTISTCSLGALKNLYSSSARHTLHLPADSSPSSQASAINEPTPVKLQARKMKNLQRELDEKLSQSGEVSESGADEEEEEVDDGNSSGSGSGGSSSAEDDEDVDVDEAVSQTSDSACPMPPSSPLPAESCVVLPLVNNYVAGHRVNEEGSPVEVPQCSSPKEDGQAVEEEDLDERPTDYSLRFQESEEPEYLSGQPSTGGRDQGSPAERLEPKVHELHQSDDEDEEQKEVAKSYFMEATPFDTPCPISRADSLSSLEESSLDANVVSHYQQEKGQLESPEKCLTPPLPPALCSSQPEDAPESGHLLASAASHDIKRVTFHPQETPLVFSRHSSFESLNSCEQISIRTGYSSCDFSRMTSGRVSPSDLPDSPCQSRPFSPGRPKESSSLAARAAADSKLSLVKEEEPAALSQTHHASLNDDILQPPGNHDHDDDDDEEDEDDDDEDLLARLQNLGMPTKKSRLPEDEARPSRLPIRNTNVSCKMPAARTLVFAAPATRVAAAASSASAHKASDDAGSSDSDQDLEQLIKVAWAKPDEAGYKERRSVLGRRVDGEGTPTTKPLASTSSVSALMPALTPLHPTPSSTSSLPSKAMAMVQPMLRPGMSGNSSVAAKKCSAVAGNSWATYASSSHEQVKVYAVEGTPQNFSTATSLSDLTVDDVASGRLSVDSNDGLIQHHQQDRSSPFRIGVAGCLDGVSHAYPMDQDKTVPQSGHETPFHYATEGTPAIFSRSDSLSSLDSDDCKKEAHLPTKCQSLLPRPQVLGRSESSGSSRSGSKVNQKVIKSKVEHEQDEDEDESEEDQLLANCLSSGMPKSRSEPLSLKSGTAASQLKLRAKKVRSKSKSPRNSGIVPGVRIAELKLLPKSMSKKAAEMPPKETENAAQTQSATSLSATEAVMPDQEQPPSPLTMTPPAALPPPPDSLIGSMCSSSLSTVQPPSIMENLVSLSSEKPVSPEKGSVKNLECRHTKRRGNFVPEMVRRALGLASSHSDELSSSLSSCQSNLDMIKAPTLLEDVMNNSIMSIASLSSEVADAVADRLDEALAERDEAAVVEPPIIADHRVPLVDPDEEEVNSLAADITLLHDILPPSAMDELPTLAQHSTTEDPTLLGDIGPPTLMDDVSGALSSETLVANQQVDAATYTVNRDQQSVGCVDADLSTCHDLTDICDESVEPTLMVDQDNMDDDIPDLPRDSSRESTPRSGRKHLSGGDHELELEQLKQFRAVVPNLDDSDLTTDHTTSGYRSGQESSPKVSSRQRRKEDLDRFKTHTIAKGDLVSTAPEHQAVCTADSWSKEPPQEENVELRPHPPKASSQASPGKELLGPKISKPLTTEVAAGDSASSEDGQHGIRGRRKGLYSPKRVSAPAASAVTSRPSIAPKPRRIVSATSVSSISKSSTPSPSSASSPKSLKAKTSTTSLRQPSSILPGKASPGASSNVSVASGSSWRRSPLTRQATFTKEVPIYSDASSDAGSAVSASSLAVRTIKRDTVGRSVSSAVVVPPRASLTMRDRVRPRPATPPHPVSVQPSVPDKKATTNVSVGPKKEVTSKIASLWKRVEESKKKHAKDKKDNSKIWMSKGGQVIPESERALLKVDQKQKEIIDNFQKQKSHTMSTPDVRASSQQQPPSSISSTSSSIKSRSRSRLSIKLSKFGLVKKDNSVVTPTSPSADVTPALSTPPLLPPPPPPSSSLPLEPEESSSNGHSKNQMPPPASAIVAPFNYSPPNKANKPSLSLDSMKLKKRSLSAVRRNDSYVSSMGRTREQLAAELLAKQKAQENPEDMGTSSVVVTLV